MYPKIVRTKHMVTGQFHQTIVLKIISFNSGQLEIRERAIINNSVNGTMLITMNRVIKPVTLQK